MSDYDYNENPISPSYPGNGNSEETARTENTGDTPEREGTGAQPMNAQQPADRAVPRQPYGYNDERRSWSEPVYEPATRFEAYTPGGYAYGAQNVPPQPPEDGKKKKKKEKRSHGFLKAVCLVIVCALVAGAASWLVVDYMLDNGVANPGKTVIIGGAANSLANENEPEPTPGEELTGNQIYKLGEKQAVGVNTSFNTTNIFGMTTPRAVSGSGFIISEDGYILTNYHVISYAVVYGGDLTVLMKDGTEYEADIVGYVEDNDVAVIKIDATGLTPVVFGDSDKIIVGEAVYAIGNPLGELEYTMTDGIVSAQDRVISTRDEITKAETSINMFQITAAVNSGNSGGPVYNSRGEVIGIVTAKYMESGVEGLGFAIPINDAVSISRQLIEHGALTGAGLGIHGRDVTVLFNEVAMEAYSIPYGVYVESINSGSAAEKAGLRVGDIITAIGGKEVNGMDSLKLALKRFSPGDTTTLTVYHMGDHMSAGESRDLTITLEEPAEDTTQQQSNTPSSGNNGGFNWPW